MATAAARREAAAADHGWSRRAVAGLVGLDRRPAWAAAGRRRLRGWRLHRRRDGSSRSVPSRGRRSPRRYRSRREPRSTRDQRADDRRGLRELAVVDALDRERRGVDRAQGVAVAVAAVAEHPPRAVQAVLPLRQPRLVRADVLGEQELPPGLSTRATSSSTAAGSSAVQSTSVAVTVSKLSSGSGRASPGAWTTSVACEPGDASRAAGRPSARTARS